MMSKRPLIIGSLLAVVAGLVMADREVLVAKHSEPEILAPPKMSQLDPSGTRDSSWYCIGGTGGSSGIATMSVVIANIGQVARGGTITWFGSEGTPVVKTIQADAYRSSEFQSPAEMTPSYLSAMVELDGGEVVVEHVITGPRGNSAAPCVSEPSKTWYLANGSTARDATQVLMIFNPFPTEAVVDITFSTSEGNDSPVPLQGLPIPARSMKALDLSERRRDFTSSFVNARTGRVVVERLQSFDGSADRVGASLTPAAPVATTTWLFPRGYYDASTTERWHIYNPTNREAQVSIEITTDDQTILPEPIDLVITQNSRTTVDSAEQARVPPGMGYAVQVNSLNEVPIVVEREVIGRSPSPPRGWSSALGSPRSSIMWVFPVGESSETVRESLVVQNPGTKAVTFSVFTIADGVRSELSAFQNRELKPGGRLNLALYDQIRLAKLPLIVEATAPLVAERSLDSMTAVGASWVMGVPAP